MPRIIALVVIAVFLPLCRPVGAQSLGDVAKKEGERRQGVKPSGRVITNGDLPVVPPPSVVVPVTPDASAAAAGAGATSGDGKKPVGDAKSADAAGKGDQKGDTKADAKDAPRDEKYWADKMKGLRDENQRDQMFAESLQSRINALTVDFVNRDNRVEREKIATDRQAALDQLERVKKGIVDRNKAIADLEEEARRAGVPAGWLR